jgi:hypothetical protein
VTDLIWAFAQWLAGAPGRPLGCVAFVVVIGFFGGYLSRRNRRR